MSIRPCSSIPKHADPTGRRQWLSLCHERVNRRHALNDQRCRLSDEDRDRVPDFRDNCRAAANPEQRDFDLDGIGDFCDHDDDNDGTPDALDPAPQNARISSIDILA